MTEVVFSGPAGNLQGDYRHQSDPRAPVAVIMHPDPQLGGTMNNRIVYYLYRLYVSLGFSALRFNFRGSGLSEGKFDHGLGEISDAAAALDWMQERNPEARDFWVTGLSFGAWVAMQLLMRRPEIGGFVSISPPVNRYDFSFLAPCPSSGLILHGDCDRLVPRQSVRELVQKLRQQKDRPIAFETVPGADHLFETALAPMTGAIRAYLDDRLELSRPVVAEEKIRAVA